MNRENMADAVGDSVTVVPTLSLLVFTHDAEKLHTHSTSNPHATQGGPKTPSPEKAFVSQVKRVTKVRLVLPPALPISSMLEKEPRSLK